MTPWKSRSKLKSDPQRGRSVDGRQKARRTARLPSEPDQYTHFDDTDEAFLAINVSFLAGPRTGSPGQFLPLATGSFMARCFAVHTLAATARQSSESDHTEAGTHMFVAPETDETRFGT